MYSSLSQKGRIMAEYVWIGGAVTTGGLDLRSKSRTLNFRPKCAEELPEWNYDGSSTNQAPGTNSEVVIKPVAMFSDPFRGGDNILVLCATYTPEGEALETNAREAANALFKQDLASEPWFGIEQEYTLFEADGHTPMGWPKGGFPAPQGPYYCSAGANVIFGRQVVEEHYKACLHAGIDISGINAEVMPGQWEYQVGPCVGISAGDQLIMSRYIMIRICEIHGVNISFHPKPIKGDWNGAGCHTNYSTAAMRAEGGYTEIIKATEKLGAAHEEHIREYGDDNHHRLTGAHETASMEVFSYGVANRGASVRIPRQAEKEGKGYLEDRRPASNMDPYKVTSLIFKTTVL